MDMFQSIDDAFPAVRHTSAAAGPAVANNHGDDNVRMSPAGAHARAHHRTHGTGTAYSGGVRSAPPPAATPVVRGPPPTAPNSTADAPRHTHARQSSPEDTIVRGRRVGVPTPPLSAASARVAVGLRRPGDDTCAQCQVWAGPVVDNHTLASVDTELVLCT